MERTIDVHIRALRRKLGEHADVIETVRGVGYRFRDSEVLAELA
jgi:DNA-binding response OmpR family regulator